MSPSIVQGVWTLRRSEDAARLDRAIAWADFIVTCLRSTLPVLAALGADQSNARRALRDVERRADALRGRRDLLQLTSLRRRRAT
jgi:hypothetical protein